MLIRELMTQNVITTEEDKTILEVRELMRNKNIRRLPVTDDIKRIKGMITDGDVGRSEPSDATTLSKYEANYLLSKLRVRDVMTKTVITVNDTSEIEEAAYLLYTNKIGALPVLDIDNKLCGIVTDSDIFKAFVDIMGFAKTSTKITVDASDQVGVLADVASIFKKRGINIISAVTRSKGPESAEIMIRADLTHGLDVIEEIRQAGYTIKDISTVKGNGK